MLIFDEQTKPIILESITAPTVTEYYWVLDLDMMDYTLTELTVLEEIKCPSVEILVNDFSLFLPAFWNLLVFSEETSQLDVVQLANAAGENFKAVVFGPDNKIVEGADVRVIDFKPQLTHVGPSLNKHQMLCHPISNNKWINVSPADAFNKYLKTATLGDLI